MPPRRAPIRRVRFQFALLLGLWFLIAPGLVGCREASSDTNGGGATPTSKAKSAEAEGPWFVDVAPAWGLDFVHTTGATGEFYFPEIAASGCALFDYDGDGDLDVYAIQCHPLAPDENAKGANVGRNRLFRNDLGIGKDGRPVARFVDVTDAAGVGDGGYGMGCAVGDYDNDGDLDIYVTNYGPNVLYRNNGDGTFTDVSAGAIPAHDTWSTSAAFVDYDKDGALDLFVADYDSFHVMENKICHSRASRRDYCGPKTYDPVPDHLFHNNGDGTFTEVTSQAGIDRAFGSGLGVVCADFNGDGWPDIYVANDGNANQLWINGGDGTFENTALLAGVAYNGEGAAEAGMGVTAGDFDLDGDDDIFLAHLMGEHNTLLINDGRGFFEDRTDDRLLGATSRPMTAFGVAWSDLDGDGYLDLFIANGAVTIAQEHADLDYPYPYPNQVMLNLGPPDFKFEDVSAKAGADVTRLDVSRGAAFGDVDNDGDIDILVSNSNGPLRLLRNEVGHLRSWLSLRLEGVQSNRSAIGAIVRLERKNGPALLRRVHADGSYCSANDLRVYFGLGDDRSDQTVTVVWPSGRIERFTGLTVNSQHDLREAGNTPSG